MSFSLVVKNPLYVEGAKNEFIKSVSEIDLEIERLALEVYELLSESKIFNPKIATDDIFCAKQLYHVKDENKYKSNVQHFEYVIDIINKLDENVFEKQFQKSINHILKNTIEDMYHDKNDGNVRKLHNWMHPMEAMMLSMQKMNSLNNNNTQENIIDFIKSLKADKLTTFISREIRIDIEQGFHSNKIKDKRDLQNNNTVFVIPKGARYFINSKEYVSDTIIFKNPFSKYNGFDDLKDIFNIEE